MAEPTVQDVMTALRKADEQGNTEDAKRLAVIADNLVNKGTEQPRDSNALGFMNRGIASVLGAPVDIATAGLNLIPGVDIQQPVGGRQSIERGFRALGIATPEEGQVPQTAGEQIGQAVGEVGGSILPFGAVARTFSVGKGIIGAVSRQILRTAQQAPVATGVAEIGSGIGVGTARAVTEDVESPALRTSAELAGGIVGGLSPTVAANTTFGITKRLGERLVRRVGLPFTEKGARFRAGSVLKEQVSDPEVARQRAIGAEGFEDVPLPAAVASGEKRLQSLLKSFRELDPNVDDAQIEKLGHAMTALEQQLRKEGFGAPEVMREITQARVQALQARMTKRMADATQRAEKKIGKLNPTEKKSQESIIVRDELKKVADAEFQETQKIWKSIDMQEKVSFPKTREKFLELRDTLSQAELEDMPAQAKNSFMFKDKIKSTDTTVLEMNGLRKKMSEVARIARSENKFNKARLADEIEDAIIDELDEQGAGEGLKTAIAATRSFKERFQRGTVGKILGFSREGGVALDPTLTLENSLARTGVRGAVDIDKILLTPEARNAAQRHITRSYVDVATAGGKRPFDFKAATKWINDNQEILDHFPELRALMTDARSAVELADSTNRLMAGRLKRLQDPRMSTASRFLGTEVGEEIPEIMKGKGASQRVSQLVRQARKDPTGEALEGLRGGFIQDIIDKSGTKTFTELGERKLSGSAMMNYVRANQKILRQVFDQEQLVRIRKVATEMVKIENAENIKAKALTLDELDAFSGMMILGSRIGGAQLGNVIARHTGGGTIQTASITSQRFKNIATRLTKDRAAQLIHDAITSDSPELLNSLLMPIAKPTAKQGQNLIRLHKAVNAWLLGQGNRVLRDIEEEMAEEEGITQQFTGGS